MARRDDPPPERAGWRVARSWREKSVWYVRQADYAIQSEAWAAYHAEEDALAGLDDGQIDLYDLAAGEVLETVRAGAHLVDADKVITTKAQLTARLNTLFGRPAPITIDLTEGDGA